MSVTAGAVMLSAGCIVTGATLNVGGGILNYNSAGSVAAVNLTAGTLGGTSPVTVTNTFTITIDPATLTIAVLSQSKVYGAADPTLTFTVSVLQFSDTPATVLAGVLTRAPGETVAGGPYPITQGTLTANSNYTISFTGNTLTITPAALTVTASAQSKTYGATLVLGTSAFTTGGLQNGETVGSVTLTASGSPAGTAATAAAGSYTITPSAATGGTFNPANYAITYATGTLTVNPAALSVTADAKTKTYGAADPTFTVTYAGFVNGETPAVLGGTLTLTRAPGENIGSYLITPSGLTSANYTITFNTGTLAITAPAPLILALTSAGPNNVVITWSAVSNATYRVQYKGVLSATNWTDLLGDILAGDSTASMTDINTRSNRFYRIQVVP